jgi:ABC-type branched-subunit amino acid transport system substrate-binding protein
MVYGKGLTPFLRLARDAGAGRLADGIGMLIEQAAEAFLWWRGVRPSTTALIEKTVRPAGLTPRCGDARGGTVDGECARLSAAEAITKMAGQQLEVAMKRFLAGLMLAGTALLASGWVMGQGGPVKIFGLVELSGGGATSGTNFDEGAKLAVKEINAAGGILGRKIEYTSSDTQSQPQIAKALAQQAVDADAYVVLGPVFSGSILVSMAETKRAEVPNFTGGEAASITQQGNPYIFRTSFTQSDAMPKVARYLKDTVKAKTVAVMWVNNDFGKGGRDVMMKALETQGIKVAADISTDPGQVDFSSRC